MKLLDVQASLLPPHPKPFLSISLPEPPHTRCPWYQSSRELSLSDEAFADKVSDCGLGLCADSSRCRHTQRRGSALWYIHDRL